MVHLFAAAGVADAASKVVSGAASVWKHIASGGHAGAKKPEQAGSFASLLAGQGIDPSSSGAAAGAASGPGKISRVASVATPAPGAIDRVA